MRSRVSRLGLRAHVLGAFWLVVSALAVITLPLSPNRLDLCTLCQLISTPISLGNISQTWTGGNMTGKDLCPILVHTNLMPRIQLVRVFSFSNSFPMFTCLPAAEHPPQATSLVPVHIPPISKAGAEVQLLPKEAGVHAGSAGKIPPSALTIVFV